MISGWIRLLVLKDFSRLYISHTNPHFGLILDYQSNPRKKYTFRLQNSNFSHSGKDSIGHQVQKEIGLKKGVYLPWLICELIISIEALSFPCMKPYLEMSKNACDITLKHVFLPGLYLRQNPAIKLYQLM